MNTYALVNLAIDAEFGEGFATLMPLNGRLSLQVYKDDCVPEQLQDLVEFVEAAFFEVNGYAIGFAFDDDVIPVNF